MSKNIEKKLNENEKFFILLKNRFEKNMHRHRNLKWEDVIKKINENPKKLKSLIEMEETDGEPDLIELKKGSKEIIFFDCSKESPSKRRSLCYDDDALRSRKENKPKGSALGLSIQMGIEILTEEDYRFLQTFEEFDLKTSSWIQTPSKIRGLGGALFCDRRFDTVFTYHNGAESYYAARGFRGKLIF